MVSAPLGDRDDQTQRPGTRRREIALRLATGYAGIRFLGTFRIPSELPGASPSAWTRACCLPAWRSSGSLNAMLFSAGGIDLAVYLVVVPSIILVAMLASFGPTRRASLRCD